MSKVQPEAVTMAISALLISLGVLGFIIIASLTSKPFEVPLDDESDENSYS